MTDQEPKSGEEVEEGTRVTIYYSQESSGITIPDVTNKSLEDATSQLESSNLTVKGTTEKYSDIVAKGKVCGTDPVVGSSVAKGTAVTLIISKGPENDMVRVPNLVKKSLEVARERLADVGWKLQMSRLMYIVIQYRRDMWSASLRSPVPRLRLER